MSKDPRPFIQLALDFPDHPKIRPLSDKAFRILVEMLAWSSDQGTDGFVAEAMFKTFGTPGARKELLTNDPKRPSVVAVADGYQLHDFEKHNRLRAEIDEIRAKRAAAGAKGGKAKANAKQPPEQTGSNFYPDVRSQMTEEQDTHSQGPVSLAPSYPQGTDESESVEVLCARQAGHMGVDFIKVKTAIGKVCGRFPEPTSVMQIIATVLERAKPPVKSPTGLVLAAVREDWAEWQKFLDEAVAS